MKLIDKDALVAEIERLEYETNYEPFTDEVFGKRKVCKDIKDFLNTIEGKEVDLEKVFNDEYSKFSNDVDAMDYVFPIDLADYKDFAKHFFELGVQQSKNYNNNEE